MQYYALEMAFSQISGKNETLWQIYSIARSISILMIELSQCDLKICCVVINDVPLMRNFHAGKYPVVL